MYCCLVLLIIYATIQVQSQDLKAYQAPPLNNQGPDWRPPVSIPQGPPRQTFKGFNQGQNRPDGNYGAPPLNPWDTNPIGRATSYGNPAPQIGPPVGGGPGTPYVPPPAGGTPGQGGTPSGGSGTFVPRPSPGGGQPGGSTGTYVPPPSPGGGQSGRPSGGGGTSPAGGQTGSPGTGGGSSPGFGAPGGRGTSSGTGRGSTGSGQINSGAQGGSGPPPGAQEFTCVSPPKYRTECPDGRRSQFTLRWYARNGECCSYPYGHCKGEDIIQSSHLLRTKEACDDVCLGIRS